MQQFIKIAEILKEIDSDTGRNFKKSILEQNKDNKELKLLFRITYDPYIKFNVARVELAFNDLPVRVPYGHDYTFDHFLDDLNKLVNKEVTGHDALNWVTAIYKTLPTEFQPYLERILKKDLKIGVSTATINDIWPAWIPEFKLGLCERWKKVRNPKTLQFPMIAEPKIDGIRVLAFVYPETQKVEMMSRSGIKYENFKVIEKELLNIRSKSDVNIINGRPVVFDGEIIDKTFQGIMNNARRLYDVDCNDAIFYIWDILDAEEFLNEISSLKQRDRKNILHQIIWSENPHLRMLDYKVILELDEVKESFEEYFNKGFEGVILKDPESYYIYSSGSKRGKAWLKYKIQDYNRETGEGISEFTVQITGYYLGESDTKFRNVLGGFTYIGIAELKDGVKVAISGNCGGGYSDEQREDFWNRREELMGSFMDVESQEVTTNKEGAHSLRFPVFVRFRPDLNKESAN